MKAILFKIIICLLPIHLYALEYKEHIIKINVKDIDIIDNSTATKTVYEPSIMPNRAIIKWANSRLRAGGETGVMEFIIEDANFTEQKIEEGENKMLDLIWNDKTKYSSHYIIKMQLYSDDKKQDKVAESSIEAYSTKVIEGSLSLNKRDALIDSMLQELIDNTEYQIEESLRSFFKPHIKFCYKDDSC